MADNAISTNTKLVDELSLTGKPALVQNNLGIFYGFLEKSDTRNGTALIRDGFMLSPDKHITFTQYLDFLSSEIEFRHLDIRDQFDDSTADSEDGQPDDDSMLDESLMPNEVVIDQETFNEHKRDLTITDYASEGIFMVQHRTSTYENSKHIQSRAPLISLTNVIAIVAISETTVAHASLNEVIDDIDKLGLMNLDSLDYLDALTPMITFGLLNHDLQVLMSLALHESGQDIKLYNDKLLGIMLAYGEPKVTPAYKYIVESISNQVKTIQGLDGDKDIKIKDIAPFLKVLTNIPSLVVNSEKRVELYKEKATAGDEQHN